MVGKVYRYAQLVVDGFDLANFHVGREETVALGHVLLQAEANLQ
jgi:hypothetical protein